jgi:hypothetical protein
VGGPPDSRTGGTPVPVTVGKTTDLGDVQLTAGAAITGTVKSADGTPIRHAGVDVYASNGSSMVYASTRADGTYGFKRLTAGKYVVCFQAQHYAAQCYRHVPWNALRKPPANATKVIVTSGVVTRGIGAKLHKS